MGSKTQRRIHPVWAVAMVVVASLLQLGAGCEPEKTAGPAAIQSVRITRDWGKDTLFLAPGAQQQLFAVVRNVNGLTVARADYTAAWSTTNSAVASVNQDGLVGGLAQGNAVVRVTVDGKFTDSVFVRVEQPADQVVAKVEIQMPGGSPMVVGTSQQLTAIAKNAAGVVLPGRTATWSVTTADIAVISPTGRLTALKKGNTSFTATIDGVQGFGLVTVRNEVVQIRVTHDSLLLAVGETQRIEDTPVDAAGEFVSGAGVQLSSTNPAVATVGTSGTVTALAPGRTTIVFEADRSRTEVPVTVYTPVTGLTLSPHSAALSAGDTLRFQAVIQGGTGLTPVWSSTAPGVATVDGTGLVRAVGPGDATIRVTVGGFTAEAFVTVAPGITGIELWPESIILPIGATQQFDATVHGGVNPQISWSSTNTDVATVSSTGLVTAVAEGDADIIARAGTVADTALVIVFEPTEPDPGGDGEQQSVVVYGESPVSLKRLQDGGVDEFSFLMAGDHDPTGDGTIQGFITFRLDGVMDADSVIGAIMRVGSTEDSGDVSSLGMLYVELATNGVALNEGAVSQSAVPVREGSNYNVDVDITRLVRQAIAENRSTMVLRFRFHSLVSANASVDYSTLDVQSLSMIIVR